MAKGWRDWVEYHFPHVCKFPFADRHVRLWNWIESLKPGAKPRSRIEIWGRGGAKSTTLEIGCCYVQHRGSRNFVLYVCDTQDRADEHVSNIATLMEHLDIDRMVGRYGNSKGWRRNQLRTASGFNVAALGLDAAARGVKLGQYRPDWIILDDIDDEEDTPKTTEKKKRQITKKILPAGSSDCAVSGIQNLVTEDGIFSQLVDGRAGFLLDREISKVEVAVHGLKVVLDRLDSGESKYRVTGGEPTWDGQDLSICEAQINEWGLSAFLEEAQNEVASGKGHFFDANAFEIITRDALKDVRFLRIVLAWDLAATEGAGDYTVWLLMGIAPNNVIYVIDAFREQISSEKVEAEIVRAAKKFKAEYPNLTVRLPQDPGQAGKSQANTLRKKLTDAGFPEDDIVIKNITGSKATRAKPWAGRVNSSNVRLFEGPWNNDFRKEHRRFREDERHEFDDQVDAAADGFEELNLEAPKWQTW